MVISKVYLRVIILKSLCMFIPSLMQHSLVTVAEQSKACTVFARSEPVIVGLNPTQSMDV
jgi:hypothetical protein